MTHYTNLVFKTFFFVLLATNVLFLFYKPPLPGHEELLPEINNEPVQEKIEKNPFQTSVKSYTYTLEPEYSYKLYGLVVSLYDSGSWLDISHKNDPQNVRDLCVIWGDNAKSDGYKELKYKSGEFTCFFRWRGEKPEFNQKHLSNNHIIPQDTLVAEKIRDINIGDQIYIEGKLADYSIATPDGTFIGKRTTSTNRDDTGNGACEIVYVENVEILKRGNMWYYNIKSFAKAGVIYLVLLWIVFNIATGSIKKRRESIAGL